MEKDVQFAFRVDSNLRRRFVEICKELDRPAGQVLREYMRGFVSEHGNLISAEELMDNKEQQISGVKA